MPAEESLQKAWDRSAEEWIRWARSHELDHAFWRLNLPATLALLPAPGRLTLDVGCGEGRLARELIARGHGVVGIEASPALARAAREAEPTFEVHVADSVDMPLEDDSADVAVTSLSLMNMDDPAAAIAEVARVLRPGGCLCASLLHPLNSWGDARERAGDVSYFEVTRYVEVLERGGDRIELHDTHRPFGDYARALGEAGFEIDRIEEPVPDDDHVAAHPGAERWRDRPAFLHLRARLRGGPGSGAS